MEKNEATVPKKKGDMNRLTVVISLLVSAVLFVVDLYIMINMPANFVALIIVSILLVVGVFFFINAMMHEMNRNKKSTEEQYENIFKSEKASYLLLKKAFEQIAELEEKTNNLSSEEIIAAQKAIAKITISRNKENADAVMNSNDKILEKMFDIEEKIEASEDSNADSQNAVLEESLKELVERQQELMASIKGMEDSLKNEMLETKSAISEIQQRSIEASSFANVKEPELDFNASDDLSLELDLPMDSDLLMDDDLSLDSDLSMDSDLLMDDDLSLDSDLSMGESSLGELSLDDESVSEETDFTGLVDLGDSVNLLEEVEENPEELDLDQSISFLDEEEPVAEEETSVDDLLAEIAMEEPLEDTMLEETPVVDFSAEELEPIEEPELVEELEPVEEPEPVEELEIPETPEPPKEEMPDLSDPHKLMTPDEIAALIANM